MEGASELASSGELGDVLYCLDVIKHFGQVTALNSVSVTLRCGEVLSVLGKSGSGKSTLMLCLAGVIGCDSGAVVYRGRPLNSLNDAELSKLRRTDFGFVFQFGHLLSELTGLENVSLPLLLNGCHRAKATEMGLAQLESLGVPELAHRRPGEMSGGEAQRVAVARALVTGPAVIFADEPTGALDSLNAALVMELLVDAARAQNAAVLLVTHDHDIAAYGDREIRMQDGRLVSDARLP